MFPLWYSFYFLKFFSVLCFQQYHVLLPGYLYFLQFPISHFSSFLTFPAGCISWLYLKSPLPAGTTSSLYFKVISVQHLRLWSSFRTSPFFGLVLGSFSHFCDTRAYICAPIWYFDSITRALGYARCIIAFWLSLPLGQFINIKEKTIMQE